MTECQSHSDHSSLEHSDLSESLFPTTLGMMEDYRHLLPAKGLVLLLTNQDFIMNQGVPELVAWESLLSNYNFLFAKWINWCQYGGPKGLEGW